MKRPAIPITMIHIAVENYFVLYKFPQGFAVTAGACALFLFLEFDVHGTQGGLYLCEFVLIVGFPQQFLAIGGNDEDRRIGADLYRVTAMIIRSHTPVTIMIDTLSRLSEY